MDGRAWIFGVCGSGCWEVTRISPYQPWPYTLCPSPRVEQLT